MPERSINLQLTEYFSQHFNVYLSAFRPGYGCQSTLLRVIEDWKQALDNNKYVAAILMDLSKAFDCLPHDLLLLKLETYGFSENALKLIKSYLSNRKQCVKLGNIKRVCRWGQYLDRSCLTFLLMTFFIFTYSQWAGALHMNKRHQYW